MTETESDQSPFASPSTIDNGIQQVVGEQVFQVLRYLQRVYIAMGLQLGSAVSIPLVAGLASAFSGDRTLDVRLGYLIYGWMAVLYVFSAYYLLRLLIACRSHVFTLVAYGLFALCPCIGLFALLTIAETMRDSLERQGVPFRRTGPDWQALRELAARQSTDEKPLPPENLS